MVPTPITLSNTDTTLVPPLCKVLVRSNRALKIGEGLLHTCAHLTVFLPVVGYSTLLSIIMLLPLPPQDLPALSTHPPPFDGLSSELDRWFWGEVARETAAPPRERRGAQGAAGASQLPNPRYDIYHHAFSLSIFFHTPLADLFIPHLVCLYICMYVCTSEAHSFVIIVFSKGPPGIILPPV